MTLINFILMILTMIASIILAFFGSLALRSMLYTKKGQSPKIIKNMFNLQFIKEALKEL